VWNLKMWNLILWNLIVWNLIVWNLFVENFLIVSNFKIHFVEFIYPLLSVFLTLLTVVLTLLPFSKTSYRSPSSSITDPFLFPPWYSIFLLTNSLRWVWRMPDSTSGAVLPPATDAFERTMAPTLRVARRFSLIFKPH
jgi:hypothetical protein